MNHGKSTSRSAKSPQGEKNTGGGKRAGLFETFDVRTQAEPSSLGPVPADVLDLMERLRAKGHGVWVVGGAVRDLLTGVAPRDWDVATDAETREILDLFPKVIPLGLRYGTLQVHTSQRQVEMTSLATAADGNIFKDLARRDFTINAMALVFPTGELLDPHKGKADLGKKILRAVGNPTARLMEDPLRMLRAARFVSTLGLRPAPSIFAACRDQVYGLDRTARERIREEFFRILVGTRVVQAFEFLRRTGILEKLLPEFRLDGSFRGGKRLFLRNYRHAVGTVSLCPLDGRVRLAAFFHCLGNPCPAVNGDGLGEWIEERDVTLSAASRVMTRWKTAHKDMREVLRLLEHWIPPGGEDLSPPALRRLVLGVGEELLEDLVHFGYADRRDAGNERCIRAFDQLVLRIKEQMDGGWIVGRSQLDLSGEDIMETLGIGPGPRVGEFLKRLHDFVIEDPRANRREILLEKLRQISPKTGPPAEGCPG